jgi:molybdate transport system permease protein
LGQGLLTVVVYLPLVLPPVVTGYALLLMFGSNGYVGSLLADLGIVFAFRWTGAVLAAAIMGFPLMVRAIQQALDASDKGFEAAAASLRGFKNNMFSDNHIAADRTWHIGGCHTWICQGTW